MLDPGPNTRLPGPGTLSTVTPGNGVTLEPVAIPRYWRVIDDIPVNSMNKRVYAQLQEFFHDTP